MSDPDFLEELRELRRELEKKEQPRRNKKIDRPSGFSLETSPPGQRGLSGKGDITPP